MKLTIENYLGDSGGACCDLEDDQGHVVAECGTIEDAQEIVRRVNAHEPLVEALRDLIEIAQASIVNARTRNEYSQIVTGLEIRESKARAALALAEKGE